MGQVRIETDLVEKLLTVHREKVISSLVSAALLAFSTFLVGIAFLR